MYATSPEQRRAARARELAATLYSEHYAELPARSPRPLRSLGRPRGSPAGGARHLCRLLRPRGRLAAAPVAPARAQAPELGRDRAPPHGGSDRHRSLRVGRPRATRWRHGRDHSGPCRGGNARGAGANHPGGDGAAAVRAASRDQPPGDRLLLRRDRRAHRRDPEAGRPPGREGRAALRAR